MTTWYPIKNECCPIALLQFENFHIFYKGQCENTFCMSAEMLQQPQIYKISAYAQPVSAQNLMLGKPCGKVIGLCQREALPQTLTLNLTENATDWLRKSLTNQKHIVHLLSRFNEMAKNNATKEQVETFLKRFKERANFFGITFSERDENLDTLIILGITYNERKTLVLNLVAEDYYQGPDDNLSDTYQGDVWMFGIRVKEKSSRKEHPHLYQSVHEYDSECAKHLHIIPYRTVRDVYAV